MGKWTGVRGGRQVRERNMISEREKVERKVEEMTDAGVEARERERGRQGKLSEKREGKKTT